MEERDLLGALGVASLTRMASCIEFWILVDYQARPGITPRVVWTESGRRSQMDHATKLAAIQRLRRGTGSSTTFIHGATGDRGLDTALTQGTCNLFLQKLQCFQAARRISVCWDPGTYTGLHWNVGAAFSVDLGIKNAVALPIKVTLLLFYF